MFTPPSSPRYNGALGLSQRAWLQRQLEACRRAGERAVVCGHCPLLAAATQKPYSCWDGVETAEILDRFVDVVCPSNGWE
jgi:hypothetical protein